MEERKRGRQREPPRSGAETGGAAGETTTPRKTWSCGPGVVGWRGRGGGKTAGWDRLARDERAETGTTRRGCLDLDMRVDDRVVDGKVMKD